MLRAIQKHFARSRPAGAARRLLAVMAVAALPAAGCKTLPATASDPSPPSPGLVQFFRRLVGASPKPEPESISVEALARYAEGLSHDAEKEYDQALEAYRKAALADPRYSPLVTDVARRALVSGNTGEAIEVLSKATEVPNATAGLYAWLAVAHRQDGNDALAAVEARKALAKASGSIAASQNLAEIYLQNSRVADALEALDQAAKIPTGDANELVGLAELYSQVGRWESQAEDATKDRVKRTLDRAAALHPKAPDVLEKLGDRYYLLEEFEKAAQAYSQLLESNPNLPLVRSRLIDIYDHTKQFDKLYAQLEVIAKEDPTDAQPFLMLGGLAMEQATDKETPSDKAKERLLAAARNFEKVLEIVPEFAPAYYQLASAHLKLSDRESATNALSILAKARSKFRANPTIELFTAFAYDRTSEDQKAIDAYTAARRLIPSITNAANLGQEFYFWAGAQNEQFGEIETAAKYFKKSLAINPDYASANNYLGYMWAEHRTNLLEAKMLIERAVAAEPNEAAYLDSMAWVLFEMHLPNEALTWMLKAIDNLREPDATIYSHLGDIHAALKDYAKAREAYTKALGVEPSDVDPDEIKKKLERLPPSSKP